MNKRQLDQLPDALSARDLSEFLNIGYTKSLRLIRFGGLPYIRIGSVYRVSKKIFIEWLHGTDTKIINIE